ncbi:MAG: hypothetical protein IJ009_01235 [Clostridia bacterium]|nr:hypothetical protein [Clostridia bacterium]
MFTTKKKIVASLVSGIVFTLTVFYLGLPALSVYSVGFWFFLTFVIAAFSWPFLLPSGEPARGKKRGKVYVMGISFKNNMPSRTALILVGVCVLPVLFCGLAALFSSAPLFYAKQYASVIDVQSADFAEDMPESTEVSNIALMDTDSAIVIGNRTLGPLSDVVSQYTINPAYMQINYKGSPRKVTPLEYNGFFKWLGNNKNGIPGIVMVDPVNSDAEYVPLSEPMYYAESAYFNRDLARKLRFSYPTKIFGSVSFEINEDGKPYYVVSCMKPQVGLFGAMDVSEVILFDPHDGSSEIMTVEKTPAWVDIVYTGYLACEKYDWHGTLSGGFFNSIIGNVGCKQTTDDFGYVVLGDDVWYFTGVTSMTSGDESNIGFILSNARTGEYKYYSVNGAEEYSAMAAAEGEVQEKGYVASFPSLINVSGEATYIMVLKDSGGLVKLYALVNVERYSIVATGETQQDAMRAYRKRLAQSGVGDDPTGGEEQLTVTVETREIVTLGGLPTVYVTAEDGRVFKGDLESDEALILIRAGDVLNMTCTATAVDGIFAIVEWEFAEAAEAE